MREEDGGLLGALEGVVEVGFAFPCGWGSKRPGKVGAGLLLAPSAPVNALMALDPTIRLLETGPAVDLVVMLLKTGLESEGAVCLGAGADLVLLRGALG